jgi:hypothetical protein
VSQLRVEGTVVTVIIPEVGTPVPSPLARADSPRRCRGSDEKVRVISRVKDALRVVDSVAARNVDFCLRPKVSSPPPSVVVEDYSSGANRLAPLAFAASVVVVAAVAGDSPF